MLPSDQRHRPTPANDAARTLDEVNISERRWMRTRHILMVAMLALALLAQITVMRSIFPGLFPSMTGAGDPNAQLLGVVRLSGAMSAGSGAGADKLIPALKAAFADDRVKQVALFIDSPGGAPAEAERIGRYLQAQRNKTGKPTVAIISNLGASAAYLTAIHADHIVAEKYSLVGSIGAIVQGWGLDRVMDKVGAEQRVYASGKFKAMLNPFKPMDAETAAKVQAMADGAGAAFAHEVSARRGAKLKLAEFATGEVWNGQDALEYGFIDEINTLEGYANDKKLDVAEFGPPPARSLPFMKSAAEALADAVVARSNLRLE